MIKAIIVDDEKNSIEVLEWLLTTYCPDVKVISTCGSAEEGMKAIDQQKPDLLFLDIEMPKMNGFDMLEQLKNISFDIVFITAYDNFAVRAFKYAALNYLLKPVDPDELVATIQRHKEKKQPTSNEQLSILFQNLINKEANVERIALSTKDGLIFVQAKNIVYCEAESNYTKVVMNDGQKIVVAKTLKDLDETLVGSNFFRIHNSFLININHVVKFIREDGGYVEMLDKTQITISRSKKDAFFQLFAKF